MKHLGEERLKKKIKIQWNYSFVFLIWMSCSYTYLSQSVLGNLMKKAILALVNILPLGL